MKKGRTLLLAAAILLCACAPRIKLAQIEHPEPEEPTGVTFVMTPYQYRTSVDFVTAELSNQTNAALTFDMDFALEKMVSDTEWRRVECREDACTGATALI